MDGRQWRRKTRNGNLVREMGRSRLSCSVATASGNGLSGRTRQAASLHPMTPSSRQLWHSKRLSNRWSRRRRPEGSSRLTLSPWIPPAMNKAVLERELVVSRFATRGWQEIDPVETHQSLVEGLLPSQGVVPIIGSQESFKSFLAIDIAFAVATGRPWHGRAVIQGDVVYITAEDRKGHQRRRGLSPRRTVALAIIRYPFRVIEARPFLGARREGDANAIIRAVEDEGYRPRLVRTDTYP